MLIIKTIRYLMARAALFAGTLYVNGYLTLLNIKVQNLKVKGIPYLVIDKNSKVSIGGGLRMNCNRSSNPIGGAYGCSIVVRKGGIFKIGENVGISNSSFFCSKSITIGSNTIIGGNSVIYDTDFHSLDSQNRRQPFLDKSTTKSASVTIGSDVFIGAHVKILKGVEIGDKAIIGSGSLVTKNVPSREVWAGVPAKFIKKL